MGELYRRDPPHPHDSLDLAAEALNGLADLVGIAHAGPVDRPGGDVLDVPSSGMCALLELIVAELKRAREGLPAD